MQRKSGRIWKIAIVVLLHLFLSAGLFAAETPEKPEESDKNGKEPMTRFQIAKEHHLLMQQVIASLNEISEILRRVATRDADPKTRADLEADINALKKKTEDLSEKHRRLMKAVDDLSKETTKKSPGEDREPAANP